MSATPGPPEWIHTDSTADRGLRRIVAVAFRSLVRRWPSITLVVAVWVMVDMAAWAVVDAINPIVVIFYGSWAPRWAFQPPWSDVYWVAADGLFNAFVGAVTGCIFVALLFRLCLSDRTVLASMGGFPFLRSCSIVAVVLFAHAAVLIPPSFLGFYVAERFHQPQADAYVALALGLALLLLTIWLISRLCLAYAFGAFDRGLGFRESWRAVREDQWPVFGGVLFLSFLPAVANTVTSGWRLRFDLLGRIEPVWGWAMAGWESAEFVIGRTLLYLFIAGAAACLALGPVLGESAEADAVARTFD